MRTTRQAGLRREVDGKRQVDAYIAAAPKQARAMLRQLRQLVRACAPEADERLSYRMPYYSYHGRLIYFAAFSKHVGVYIMGRSKERFARELEPYRTSPSTLRLPFGSRVPVALLKKLVRTPRRVLRGFGWFGVGGQRSRLRAPPPRSRLHE
jgi:uncharacterized protein YdhG (YjbR/CyaY superfamily)